MSMHGLPQGVTDPPRPVPEDGATLREHGRLGVAPGTLILALVFLAAFAVYYFTNWKLLSFVWRIG